MPESLAGKSDVFCSTITCFLPENGYLKNSGVGGAASYNSPMPTVSLYGFNRGRIFRINYIHQFNLL